MTYSIQTGLSMPDRKRSLFEMLINITKIKKP